MINLSARSALAEYHQDQTAACFHNGVIALAEIPLLAMVRVQGPGQDADFCQRMASQLMPLPEPGLVTQKAPWRCAWIGPNEWLLIGPDESTVGNTETAMLARLQPLLQGRVASATIVTDSRVAIAVQGQAAVPLLAKGCALDLHPAHFAIDRCAIARFARIPLLITRTRHDGYQLTVCRSQAVYLWRWLLDASAEFDVVSPKQSEMLTD